MNARIRRFEWRLGRFLYQRARGDTRNEMASNGEGYVQACVLRGMDSANGPLTVFDVGANFGLWTGMLLPRIAEAQRADARVYVFEPIPETYAKLKENIARMPSPPEVRLFQIAFSDAPGEAQMAVLSETGGTNSLAFDDAMAGQAREIVSVQKATIADFCGEQEISHIHLLKCDTEGHDANVLAGASELLKAGRVDVIQFEYNHRWVYARSYIKDVFDLVQGLPYSVARVRPDRIEVFEQWHPEMERFFEANYLIVRDSALEWFDAHRGRFDASNTYA